MRGPLGGPLRAPHLPQRMTMPLFRVRPLARATRAGAVLLLGGPALAHEGHGLAGHAHWHATDVLGFVAVALAVGALIWWRGRK